MQLARKFKDKADDIAGGGSRLEFIRDAHNAQKIDRTTRMEDYLEVIYELITRRAMPLPWISLITSTSAHPA